MDFAQLKKALENKDALKAATQSAEGQKLMRQIDPAALEQAAKHGDTAQLKAILSQVLSSPEGKSLAQKVERAVRQK